MNRGGEGEVTSISSLVVAIGPSLYIKKKISKSEGKRREEKRREERDQGVSAAKAAADCACPCNRLDPCLSRIQCGLAQCKAKLSLTENKIIGVMHQPCT